jgi:putative ABC transport system permease protein
MRVVGLGLVATIAVGIIVGLAPAFRASRPGRDAQSHGAGSTRVTERSYARRVLVVAQVAMAVLITAGAGLLARSLVNMINTPNGFDPERLISVELYLRGAVRGDSRPLFRELTAAAASVNGVSSAAVAMRLPTQTLGIRTPVSIIGKSAEPARAVLRPIGHGYFETASIALRAGRAFSSTDLSDTPRVAIVNATAVREMFGDQSPIGSRITTPLASAPMEIVGVVDDVKPAGEADRSALYVPLEQLSIGEGYLLVRTEGDPAALLPILRERLRSIAPALALDRIQLVRHTLEESRAATRFNSTLAGAFALLALLLAAVGVYGLTASEVASRWRELAVRLALGASPLQALWTALRPSAMLLAAGAGIGVLVAIGLSPRLAALLYQVDPRDRLTLASAPALLCLTGLIAAAGAVAKILRADPTITLRE